MPLILDVRPEEAVVIGHGLGLVKNVSRSKVPLLFEFPRSISIQRECREADRPMPSHTPQVALDDVSVMIIRRNGRLEIDINCDEDPVINIKPNRRHENEIRQEPNE